MLNILAKIKNDKYGRYDEVITIIDIYKFERNSNSSKVEDNIRYVDQYGRIGDCPSDTVEVIDNKVLPHIRTNTNAN